jgi:hypothetical protein
LITELSIHIPKNPYQKTKLFKKEGNFFLKKDPCRFRRVITDSSAMSCLPCIIYQNNNHISQIENIKLRMREVSDRVYPLSPRIITFKSMRLREAMDSRNLTSPNSVLFFFFFFFSLSRKF